MDNAGLRRCKEAWIQTLARFGIERRLMQSEELEIARAIQKHGAEAVELALYGAGFEPRTENFDPSQYVKIARILRPDARGEERIDRFVNLGAKARKRQALDQEKHRRVLAPVQDAADEELTHAPPEVAEKLARLGLNIGKRMPQ